MKCDSFFGPHLLLKEPFNKSKPPQNIDRESQFSKGTNSKVFSSLLLYYSFYFFHMQSIHFLQFYLPFSSIINLLFLFCVKNHILISSFSFYIYMYKRFSLFICLCFVKIWWVVDRWGSYLWLILKGRFIAASTAKPI